MTVDELVREIHVRPPGAVSALLRLHFPFVHRHMRELLQHLDPASPSGPQAAVAMFWMLALDTSGDALISGPPDRPTLTAFGDALLRQVTLNAMNGALTTPALGPTAPTARDIEALYAEIAQQVAWQRPSAFHSTVLAQMICAAIQLTPQSVEDGRRKLALVGLLLAEHMRSMTVPAGRENLLAAAKDLETCAASCIPPNMLDFARQDAYTQYHFILPAKRGQYGH